MYFELKRLGGLSMQLCLNYLYNLGGWRANGMGIRLSVTTASLVANATDVLITFIGTKRN